MIDRQESCAIVFIRAFAMLSIVLCHLFQAYNSPLATVFNVGVPIFFCISGYLYGNKTIIEWKAWAWGRFKKVYVPYAVFLVIVLSCYIIVCPNLIKWWGVCVHIFNLQGFTHSLGGVYLSGINNTWFITSIAMCYFITPVLQKLRLYSRWLIMLLLALMVAGYIFIRDETAMFVCSWFYLYAFSYFYASLDAKYKKLINGLVLCLTVAVVYMVIVKRQFSYPVSRIIKDYSGIVSVTLILRDLSRIKRLKDGRLLRLLSDYSYELYLTNYVFLVGPLSLAYYTSMKSLNIILCTICFVFCAWLVARIARMLNIALTRKV